MLIGLLQYTFMKDFLYGSRADAIHSQMMSWPPDPLFLKQNGDFSNRPGNDKLPTRPIMFQPGMEVSYIDEQGNIEIISDDEQELPPVISKNQYATILNDEVDDPTKRYYIFTDTEGNEKMVVFREHNNRGTRGLLQVSMELDSLQKQLYTQLSIYISVSLIALIVGFLLLLPSLRKALHPLTNMVKSVERTNAENLTEQLPIPHKQYEVAQLAHAYNNMLTRIEHSFEYEKQQNERMRQFIADASHELRTPITSISGFIEVLQRGAMNNKNHLTSSLKAMEQESKRMTKLVENLLQLAKLDVTTETSSMEMETFELDKLLKSMELQLTIMAAERQLQLYIEQPTNYTMVGSPHGLNQVILNLAQNAISHTDPARGSILINLSKQHNQFLLTITDNGIGIATEHIPNLFERFYRVDQARARRSGGAGLGLSISKSIIDAHQGHISVESILGSGTTFIVQLPATISNDP